ncbi:MAG: GTPase [Gammaproteobacteria bacterium]
MDYAYSDLAAKAKKWAEQAAKAGWIDREAAEQLTAADTGTPETLLGHDGRPLLVAFMGGTGVGKSSLLNRLASQAVARTGIERPTSKEVTLYHHRSVQFKHFPEQLPLEQIKTAHHDDAGNKHLVWIDMPDFDSTERHNKEIVLAWLPYVDVLIYVVSPERYRDDKAWRLLLAEGNRHAWVFVLNHWDRGDAVQFDDFKVQLGKAGFEDPLIFKTICNEFGDDDFSALKSTIETLAGENTIEQIKSHGARVRVEALREGLVTCLNSAGADDDFQNLADQWRQNWRQTAETLQQGFEWPIKRLASYYADHDKTPKDIEYKLWDDWAQGLFEDGLDEIAIQADGKQLPKAPLKRELNSIRDKAGKLIGERTELTVRQALANPGHAVQRFFLKLMFFLEIVLPLASMGWVGYRLLTGFYRSSLNNQDYLGTEFAVHSVLLIAISWLLPFFVRLKLKPSLEKTALAGLKKGLTVGFSVIESEVCEALARNRQQRQEVIGLAETLLAECDRHAASTDKTKDDKALERMLIASRDT